MKRFRTSCGNRELKFKFIAIGFFFFFFLCCYAFGKFQNHGESDGNEKSDRKTEKILLNGRALLSYEAEESNCTKPALKEFPGDLFTLEARRRGAILVHFLIACYLFILLAFICDDYFIPSIKALCDCWNLSKNVAGATFMAAAASSPELFVNVMGTFATEGDLGIGTIVGSAVFNILAVPACCGLLGGQTVKIDWGPLTRDCLAYGVTVILLIAFLRNGYIEWSESLILVALYVFYIIVMYFNDPITNFFKRLLKGRKRKYKEVNFSEKTPLLSGYKNDCIIPFRDRCLTVQVYEIKSPKSLASDPSLDQTDGEALRTVPQDFWSKCFFLFSWPISFVLFLTVPDCRQERKQKLWPLTFSMCIVWIAFTSYIVSWMITVMGDTLAIPDSVMGLTFLAAGMSVPEAVTSVIVTNQGHGNMAISSSIGSNTFDILLCLGLPWLIKSTFLPAEAGNHIVKINSRGLGYISMSLLTTLTFLYAAFALNRFVLDRKIGIVCLLMYMTFLVFACLIELNVFFTVNLPICGS